MAAGLPKYIETFKLQFKQMKEALKEAQSEHDREYIKGQMNELYKLIEMHVQSLRKVQKSMRKFAAREKEPASGEGEPKPELDEKSKAELTSFLRNLKISDTDLLTVKQKAWNQITSGDWDAAISTLTKTVELAPDDLRILVLLGWAYAGKEMYEKAEGVYELVFERDPEHPMALVNLGYISLKRCNYREAIEFLSRVLKQDRDKTAVIYANYYMGLVYLERQMFNDAVNFLQKTVKMAPNLLEACYHLGLAHKRMGDVEEARKVWQNAVGANPEDKWARISREELEATEGSDLELEGTKHG